MNDLPDDNELYPHTVTLKHKGDAWGVGLKAVKWLEAQGIMNNTDFLLIVMYEDDRIAIMFRKKKAARLFKENKKAVRDEAQDA